MKKVIFLVLTLLLALTGCMRVDASEVRRAKATAYCLKGTTASGEILDGTPKNIVASKPEWIGCTMAVWLDDGDHQIHSQNFLGFYAIEDTGSKPIKEGYVIDIYLPTYEECRQFGAPRVLYQIIESEG